MVFVYGALQWDKPFLGPLFAFLALHPRGRVRRLPVYVLIVMTWLRDRLRVRRAHPVRERLSLDGASLRVDAKAEGHVVAVGGWAPKKDKDGVIDPALSPWFYVQLTKENAPWAFVRGLPARTISTLELFATTVGLVLLAPPELDCPGASGLVSVTGLTDSQVSANVVARGLTTSYPLCTMAMELAAQLEARGAELHLEWIPRAMNKEADALADGRTEGFDPCRRVSADVRSIEWLVLDRLLASGEAFHRDANIIRERRKNKTRVAETGGGGKRQKLREREPW